MKQIGRKYHKNLAALIIILALSGLVIAGHLAGILNYAEYKTYDLRINFFAEKSRRSDDIILISLDQKSLDWAQQERGWGWPWPRAAYAEFIDYMNLGNAGSVAFDVLFSEPSIYRGADDAAFAEAAKNYGKVVHGVLFSTQSGSIHSWPENLDVPFFKPENFGTDISRFDLSNDEGVTGGQFPIKELRDTAGALGSLTGQLDKDGTIRRARLFTLFDGKAVPGLSVASLLASGENGDISYDPGRELIHWGSHIIPIDKEGKTLLRFRGDPMSRYITYSMSAVLQSAEDYAAGREPLLYPEDFEGAYVFLGFYAQGLFDIFQTPIASVYPGVGVHITMLDNLLMGDFIQKAPDWIELLIIAASVILVVLLALFSSRIAITVASLIGSFSAIIIAGFWAFNSGWWIPLTAPLIAVFLSYLTATLYNYATEGKDKRFLKQAFSRIVSPKLVDQLIVDPSQLKLGGERREMTAIFTDIQRFSSISSELQEQYGENGPKVLVDLLNFYLTEMSNIVLYNGGTIDKYEGDAIIAFFGAPIWMEDHAARACRSAIQMKKREKELVERIMNPEGEFFKPLTNLIESRVIRRERPLYTRLGINTGDMVVGFMGTPDNMDYTIMGNAVNLAARLEGVNKQYDTKGILISEYTKSKIGDDFIIRPLSRVTVVGIPVPLRLFELLEIRSEAPGEMHKMVNVWESAFNDYENRKFEEAKKTFAEVYKMDPEDTVAKLYLERCDKYISSPPPAGWNGVDNLTEK